MQWLKFGKKKKDTEKIDENTQKAIDFGVQVIDIQLKLAGGLPGFSENFGSLFPRGYFVGVFAASMAIFKIDNSGDFSKHGFQVGGHSKLLGQEHGFNFAMESMRLVGDKDFDLGSRIGMQEVVDLVNNKVDRPVQLLLYFKGN